MTENYNPGEGGRGGALLLLCIIAGLAAFIVYIPSLGNGFVTWDDTTYVVRNPNIRSMGLEFFKWAFTTPVSSNYHPLTMITLAIDYALFGLNATGYHFGNALWHALDTALFLILATRLTEAARASLPRKMVLAAALASALLFAVHPLHVESVAWVSERKDVLFTFFFFLSIIYYLKYREGERGGLRSRRPLYYGLTLLFFVLSLLAKPMAVTLPVVLLILDYYPLSILARAPVRAVLEKIPFFIVSAVSAAVTLMTQKSGGSIQGLEFYSNTDRVVIPIRAYAFYIYKTILPTGLSPIYPLPPHRGPLDAATLISLAALVIITVLAVIMARRGRRVYLAVWLYYIITLLPVIGFIKVGPQAAADRYAYITTTGFLILAGLLFASIWKPGSKAGQKARYGPGARYVVFALTGIVLAAFSSMTVAQTRVWRDPLSFWSYIIKRYPTGVPIAYHKRGVAYAKAGALRLAEADFTEAIRLQKGKSLPYFNRAKVRAQMGNLGGAIDDLTKLLEIDPTYTRVYYERGLLYERTGQYRLAVKDMKKAVELQPDLGEAYLILARLYGRLGERDLQKKYNNMAGRFFGP